MSFSTVLVWTFKEDWEIKPIGKKFISQADVQPLSQPVLCKNPRAATLGRLTLAKIGPLFAAVPRPPGLRQRAGKVIPGQTRILSLFLLPILLSLLYVSFSLFFSAFFSRNHEKENRCLCIWLAREEHCDSSVFA
jgi:hypothetical protein